MDQVKFNEFSEILVEDFIRQSGYIGNAFKLFIADFLCQTTAATGLDVTAEATPDMTVYVKPGRIYQSGQQGQMTTNLSPALTITAAHPTYDRFDRICAQYKETDDTPETRNVMVDTVSRQIIQKSVMTRTAGSIDFMVVAGVAASSPAAPTVPDGWVSLAQVKVRAATTSILQTDILDERPTLKSLMTHAHAGGIDGAQIDYNNLLNKPADYSHTWQAKSNYSVGDICYPKTGVSYIRLECTVAGTTAAAEPTWPAAGQTVVDGTVTWAVRDMRVATAQFDASTKLATSAFVQQALGNYRNVKDIVSDTVLTAADCGKLLHCYGRNNTLTLPAASSVPAGTCFHFWQSDSYTATINRSGTDTIDSGLNSYTSAVVVNTNTLTLMSNGINAWIIVGGSSQLGVSASFTASLTSNGYQKLPSGLIIQWGYAGYSGGSGSATFPIAFPTAVFNVTLGQSDNTPGPKAVIYNLSTTGFSIADADTTSNSLYYMALGR